MESFSSLQLKPFGGHHFFFLGWKAFYLQSRPLGHHKVVFNAKNKNKKKPLWTCKKKKC
jgi:hypothetical protein